MQSNLQQIIHTLLILIPQPQTNISLLNENPQNVQSSVSYFIKQSTMLPGIKEDTNSQVVKFTPRSVSRRLRSRCNYQSDLLQKKLKEIQGPKIKYPELLLDYFEKKKKSCENSTQLSFPGMEDLPQKFKSILCQTEKKRSVESSSIRKSTPLGLIKSKMNTSKY